MIGMEEEALLEYYKHEGIVLDKEIFIDMVEKMIKYPLIKKMMFNYFKSLGEIMARKLKEKGILGNDDPLVETLELCRVSGYLDSYKILEQKEDFASVRVDGAMFGETFRRKGIEKKKADEPLACYMEGVYQELTKRKVKVEEEACVAEGAPYCVFNFHIK
ncbi:hypothetical protein IPA_01910 [Ignicoccus pacificus DSM 13166]|uniref:4-vinyl reductase 4VR domain-containing protein n=1 Tax=Ignicoccus pacificus DSM 13166 TaxID=940294 RepID=A0A977KBM1_9CREN|nr:hypothetical protein IPA_01910 [Ignicoccus pacificus DSM 13166]